MSEIKTNRELAQEISARIGNAPIPFDSVYSICLEIYNELGGEPAEFDSVYSILLETLPLAESIAKKTSITEVDELPDAQDNNNIYRLSSDDKVYMSKHVSTDYTNKLPDEQQIDKAYLWESDEDIYYYKGAWKIILSDGEVDGYGWLNYISAENWYLVITQDDAVKITNDTLCFSFNSSDNAENVDFDAHTVTLDVPISYYQWDEADDLSGYGIAAVVPAIYNAPEADCIGNATLLYNGDEDGTYLGEQVSFKVNGETVTGYKWTDNVESGYYYATSKPASEIYFIKSDGYIYTDTVLWYVAYVAAGDIGEVVEFEDLYIPQLNAPDSEQVGKASFNDINSGYLYCYYTGIEKTIVLADRTFNVYLWGDDEEYPADWCYTTFKPANQIHGGSDLIADAFDSYDDWVVDGNTVTNTGITYDEFVDECVHSITDGGLSVHTIPYTRAIENWEWKQIATKDDLSSYSTKTYVDINLDLKADKTYVDTNFAKVVSLTQAQYDALATKDAHTLYIITDAQ